MPGRKHFSPVFLYPRVLISALSEDELAGEIDERYYDAVLLGKGLNTLKKQPDTLSYASFLGALEHNHHLVRQFNCTHARFAYEPNPPSTGQTVPPSRSDHPR